MTLKRLFIKIFTNFLGPVFRQLLQLLPDLGFLADAGSMAFGSLLRIMNLAFARTVSDSKLAEPVNQIVDLLPAFFAGPVDDASGFHPGAIGFA